MHAILGIMANERGHWLKRDTVANRQSHAATTCYVAAWRRSINFKSLVYHKRNCRSPNTLHLHIAEGKSFLSMYWANVSVLPLLHSSQLTINGTDTFSKVPLPLRELHPI